MAAGAAYLAFAAPPRWGFALGASCAIAFTLCAYLGLRWPAVRSTLAGRSLDDHLSWSGAFAGGAFGLLPAVFIAHAFPADFAFNALLLMYAYYALGKFTCAYIGCCDFGLTALQRRAPVPLPLLEGLAALTFGAATAVAIRSGPIFALGTGLTLFGLLRIGSRVLRAESFHESAPALIRLDTVPCLAAGLALLLVSLVMLQKEHPAPN